MSNSKTGKNLISRSTGKNLISRSSDIFGGRLKIYKPQGHA